MKKLSAGEKELVADYIVHLEDLRKGYLTCPQTISNIKLMNKTLLAVYEQIEIIKEQAERFYNHPQDESKASSRDLQQILHKLEEVSQFLKPN